MAADDEVLRELRAIRADLADQGALLHDHGERLEALREVPGKLEALRADVETLGRETRRRWEELSNTLLTEMPPAVVAAVDRSFGAELRSLRADVEELKEAVG